METPQGLADDPYDWSETKSGGIRILRGGRVVCVIGGTAAGRLAARLAAADGADDPRAQLALAKASGHYKHGTER
ncbi:hypothetical protein BA895_17710 [Humibacillus sp. DSM 29435]|uniref:hypothetical protein n=1 Tax=Humibacillus sp. DSM 29435 TaxID=1869167 RepID=UPI000871C8C8|nr:hypothetical protein [Humibacillus sp. DSM 29435]OFE17022.1 hypothetical protein BA895_17710 [Humibacillus sp. DSM 29435]